MNKPLFILLVEDNVLNQKLIFLHLSKQGYKIDIVCNGAEAIDKVKSNTYDLIIMDLMMPVMDGLESTKHIRDLGIATPMIGFTANTFDSDRERCISVGMDDYMSKPFDMNVFLSILKKIELV